MDGNSSKHWEKGFSGIVSGVTQKIRKNWPARKSSQVIKQDNLDLAEKILKLLKTKELILFFLKKISSV